MGPLFSLCKWLVGRELAVRLVNSLINALARARIYCTIRGMDKEHQLKGAKDMNTIEHAGYSIESDELSLEQLRAIDGAISNAIVKHLSINDGLYTDSDIATLSHVWRKGKWKEACIGSHELISMKEPARKTA
jgi:hypothetical protein